MLKFIFLEKLQFKIECEKVGLLGGEVGCEEDKKKNWGARQEEKLWGPDKDEVVLLKRNYSGDARQL